MDSGVAQEPINLDEYREQLESLLGKAHEVTRWFIHRAKAAPKRVIFPEGEHEKIIRASLAIVEEAIARPILLGSVETITKTAEALGISLDGVEIIPPADSSRREFYIEELIRLRQRHGVTVSEAKDLIKNHNYFASMMVHVGDADALVSAISQSSSAVGGFDVHAGIGQEVHLVLRGDERVKARDAVQAFAHAYHL